MSHVDDGTLHAYLDGELSPPEAQGLEAHVAQCLVCRERLEEERALIARATELLARAAPPERDLPPFRPGDIQPPARLWWQVRDRKSTRLNSSHVEISYAVFCLKKKKK